MTLNLKVINGKVVGRRQTHVSAPSPAEIAGLAYDRAIARAVSWFGEPEYRTEEGKRTAPELQSYCEKFKAADLAALRDEVINRRKR